MIEKDDIIQYLQEDISAVKTKCKNLNMVRFINLYIFNTFIKHFNDIIKKNRKTKH